MAKPIVHLIGRLGQDPTLIKEGTGIKFSLATNIGKDKVNWWQVVCWDERTRNFVQTYVKKGSLVTVEGEVDLVPVPEQKSGVYVNVTALSGRVNFVAESRKKEEPGTTPTTNKEADAPF